MLCCWGCPCSRRVLGFCYALAMLRHGGTPPICPQAPCRLDPVEDVGLPMPPPHHHPTPLHRLCPARCSRRAPAPCRPAVQIFAQVKFFLPDPVENDVKYQAAAQPFLVFGLLCTGLAIGHHNQLLL
jgi:hypothetical protein